MAAFGADGARYVDAARGRPSTGTPTCQLGLVRPPLQRRPGQRLRQPRQPDRVDGRPLPRRRPPGTAPGRATRRWARAGRRCWRATASGSRPACSTRRWPSCGSSSAAANKTVDAEQPWVLAKAAKAGDGEARTRLRGVLGDLVEACRLVGLAVAPFMPAIAPRVLAQLGYAYPYGADGNGGPPLLDELAWGAHAGRAGDARPESAFPRLVADAG